MPKVHVHDSDHLKPQLQTVVLHAVPMDIDAVLDRVSSKKCKQAIEYCFELDKRMPQRFLRPEELALCLKNLVKPIEAYAGVVAQTHKSFAQEPWYQGLRQQDDEEDS